MTQQGFRIWFQVHKWSSLVSTIFLLLLCLTGMPLIFTEEIEEFFDPQPVLAAVPAGTPEPGLDAIVAAAMAKRPGEVPISIGFVKDRPIVLVQSAADIRAPHQAQHRQVIDMRTGGPGDWRPPRRDGVMVWLLDLHKSLLVGLPGALFLGMMGLLIVAAVVSGVVLYAPFMRKLDFGTVRKDRSRRIYWLDVHNLLGIGATLWLLAVGATGVVNTLHDPIAALVRQRIAEMAVAHRNAPPVDKLSSVQTAVSQALTDSPDTYLVSFFFPGAPFATPHHYGIYLKGSIPITSRFFTALLVDAETGLITDRPDMPWYAKALFLSQPLHFGDYGGLPLKMIWALLNLVTIVLLGSGVYLWLRPRKQLPDAMFQDLNEANRA